MSKDSNKKAAVVLSPEELKRERAKKRGEKFVKLATQRVSRVLTEMAKVAELSNTGRFSYTTEQKDKVISALENAVSNVKARFASPAAKSDTGFRL